MDRIRDDLLNVNWNVLFFNLNVSEMTLGFTEIFFEIMSKHITHKIITCNDKDGSPLSLNIIPGSIGEEILKIMIMFGKYKTKQINCIKEVKLTFYSNLGNKLSDPQVGQNHFWTISSPAVNDPRNGHQSENTWFQCQNRQRIFPN